VNEPHIEIKTRYIYGNEVDKIIEKHTVIGLVSASSISKAGVPQVRVSYIQFLGDAIVEGTKTLLEHLEQTNTADVLDDDKYRLKKAIALLSLVKNEVYQYVGYY